MKTRPAGFWLRLAAFWLDALLIYAMAWAASTLANDGGIYLPLEAMFVCLLAVGSALSTAVLGGTIGKLACGLRVVRHDDEPVTWPRALMRETIGKFMSLAPLGLGFVWIGLAHHKRGFHDYLAGTSVQRTAQPVASNRLMLALAFATLSLWLGSFAVDWAGAFMLNRRMAPRNVAVLPFDQRDPETLADVSTLAQADNGPYVDWMKANGQPPIDYVVDKARTHQVVIIGEIHEQRQLLEFLDELVPRLYHDAGVTRIAMEVCPASTNTNLKKLVTAPEFDRELALRIARSEPWRMWGFQEYWDVLETVWKLNRSLPPDKPPMLVVGLSPDIDLPSVAMIGELRTHAPWWELLRVVRLPREFAAFQWHDAFYARQVEEHIIEPGHRGIVWVGWSHACLEVPNPIAPFYMGPRMGFMLHTKYGDRLFQIRLHGPMQSATGFLDRILDQHGGAPVGFDVEGSPFAPLRDASVWEDQVAPRQALVDRAMGYVMLDRSDRMTKCRWTPDFVTPAMFVREKPFYQAMARKEGGEVRTAEEFNALMARSPASP